MPTAGEAGRKTKSAKKASKDGLRRVSLRGKKAISNKVPDGTIKRKLAPHPSSGKSSIPVSVRKGAEGKENSDPNIGPEKNNQKSSKVKKAPDFSKLHKKWEYQLSKKKAVSKKKNTTVEAFHLTKNSQQTRKTKRPYAYNSEDEEDVVSDGDDIFEIDSTALKEILNNTGIKDEDLRTTGRASIATIPSSKSNMPVQSAGIRTSIYYTRPTTQPVTAATLSIPKPCFTPSTSRPALSPLKPRNIDTVPASSQAGSCIKKQVAWVDQAPESDVFDFQPDFNSLQSILSNTGISDNQTRLQNTGRVTLAGGRLTPYRRSRYVFREEPSKRTSIYYTGPKRTRPSPRGPAIGRISSLSARRTPTGTVNSNTYNPFATMIGRQGHLEQNENDPIASSASMQLPTRTLAPDSQTLNNNPLSTPARVLVPSAQPSFARDQPTWADILTPQRGAIVQKSQSLATGSQASLEPLRTPRKPQPFEAELFTPQRVASGIQNWSVSLDPQPFEAELFTPQRVASAVQNWSLSQDPVHSTFVNSSTTSERQPLVDSKQQLRTTCNLTPLTPRSSTRQVLTSQSVDFQSRHAPLVAQAWQPWASSQAPKSLPLNNSNAQTTSYQSSAKTLPTPVRPVPCVSRPLNSDQPQLWPEISTRQCVTMTQADCSRQRPLMTEIFTPQTGDTIPDLGSKLQLSTVHITSFQPSSEKEASASTTEAGIPQQILKEQLKSTSEKKEDDIAQLERQAMEDLGLLHISDHEVSHKESAVTSWTSYDNADDVVRSEPREMSNTWIDRCDADFPNVTRRRPLPVCCSNEPAVTTHEQHLSSYNVTSTCLEEHSSFSPLLRFANPTPVRGSRSVTTVHNTPNSGGSMLDGRHRVSSREVYADSLSLRSALSSPNPPTLFQRNTTLGADGGLQLRWDEPNSADDLTRSFRPASSSFRRTPKAVAQEVLLDLEVSTYMVAGHGRVATSSECRQRPMNPLARVFLEGDSMHFQPINS